MRRILPLILIMTAMFSATTLAQFEIGASYELREEDPKNGFGIRIQKGILSQLPIVNLGIRLHGSYYSDENSVTENGISYSEDLTNYELGVSAIGGVSLGLLEPYVGLGLGTNNYEQAISDVQNDPGNVGPTSADESSLFWNMMAGAKVSIVPKIKPFVEYRYTSYDLENPSLQDVKDSSGIIAFGVSISF
ncbi:outer membrane protein [Gracilimonas amylolytica]|uniref:outer membrane protein n=1 Tax=Gracilimonas amylolytica TaxID=1749045 RepID=UPI000CD8805B|nr:outer membrane beta-barrel protein [Gracilimonas amylolytica]